MQNKAPKVTESDFSPADWSADPGMEWCASTADCARELLQRFFADVLACVGQWDARPLGLVASLRIFAKACLHN